MELSRKRVAIIGAGVAGICSCRHLAGRPELFDVVVYEQSAGIGGVWVYDEATDQHTQVKPPPTLSGSEQAEDHSNHSSGSNGAGPPDQVCSNGAGPVEISSNGAGPDKVSSNGAGPNKVSSNGAGPHKVSSNGAGPVEINRRRTQYSTCSTEDTGSLIHSSMYANVKTNLPKEVMAFPDFPFPSDLPSYLGHKEILQYLHNYARRHDVMAHVTLNTRVVTVQPVLGDTAPMNHNGVQGNGMGTFSAGGDDNVAEHSDAHEVFAKSGPQWRVTTESRDGCMHEETFDAVLVCNGHFSVPLIPAISGMHHFNGQIIHSHNYRRPLQFKGKCVMVVGCGPSGSDIALDVATEAGRVLLSASLDKWICCDLPENVEMRDCIDHVNADGHIVYVGGKVEKSSIDAILLCTGYAFSFPFLHSSCNVAVDGYRRIRPLYKHLVHAIHPSMFFVGIPYTVSEFPLIDRQAHYITAVLSGQHTLPSTEHMLQWQADDLKVREEEGFTLKYSHFLGPKQWSYNADLAASASVPDLPAHRRRILEHVNRKLRSELMTYKTFNYRVTRDAEQGFDVL
eukprot:scpid54505/ scgid1739/ Flavin-containing monooxygenase FMO GS-OX-like 2; Flavin-monooxygenase glucosinolate S-oxygenase-like 2